MIRTFERIARGGLFLLDPEAAHGASIRALKTGLVPACSAPADPRLSQTLCGLTFPNPLGMAGGLTRMPRCRRRC